MIPNNGHIELQSISGGGLVDGLPMPVTTIWSSKIPCHIKRNTYDNKGEYVDGEFKRYAFEVWLDKQGIEAKRVRLTDNRDNILGEFEVQSIEHLDLVNRVKITV